MAMSQALGFCFLNSCNTARTPEVKDPEVRRNHRASQTSEHFVSLAHSLIEAGVPIKGKGRMEVSGRSELRGLPATV